MHVNRDGILADHLLVLSVIPWTLNNWCNLELRIFGVAEDIENIRQANTFTVINHRGDLDWMVGYCVCDRIKTLQVNSDL